MIVYLIVSYIVFPVYITILFYLWLLQKLVSLIVAIRYGNKLEHLTCADIYWTVGEKYHNLIHVVFLLNDKGEASDIERDIKTVLQNRVFRYPEQYGKLMCSLKIIMGYPFLVRENISVDDVVNVVDIESNPNYKSFQDIMFSYSNKGMPLNDKLLWEIIIIKASKEWKINNNFNENHIPVFVRFNHALADGLCLINLVSAVLGENNPGLEKSLKNIPRSPEWTRIPIVQTIQKLFLFFIVPGYMIVNYLKGEINKYEGPVACNTHYMAYQNEKKGDNILQTIKNIKRQIGDTSFSEVLLTAIAASLSNYYEQNFHKVPETLTLAFVATKDVEPLTVDGVAVLKNQFGLVNLDLPIKMPTRSLLKRLAALKKNTRDVMNKPDLMIRNFITFNLLEILPLPIIKRCIPLNGVWGCISNLPEMPKLTIFNGYVLDGMYFYTLQRDQMGTGFTFLTYDYRMYCGLIADVAAVPTKEGCSNILDDVLTNIELLREEVERKNGNSEIV